MAARMSMSWGLVAICIMAGAAEGFTGFCPAARVAPRKVGSYRPPLSTLGGSSGRRAVGLRMSVDGESALPGIWSIEAEMEDADLKCSLSLNGDRTVTLPPGTDLPHKFPTRWANPREDEHARSSSHKQAYWLPGQAFVTAQALHVLLVRGQHAAFASYWQDDPLDLERSNLLPGHCALGPRPKHPTP